MRTRNLARTPTLALCVAAGLSGCATTENLIPEDGLDDLGVAAADLGLPLASCSTASASGFGVGQVLTLALTGGPSTIMINATAGGKIAVNGWNCVNGSGAQLTTTGAVATAVKKIVINGDPTVGEKVILDLLPASFGSVLTGGATGTGFVIDLGAGAGDSFMMRGTTGIDKVTMGSTPAGDTYVDFNGDSKADVKLTGIENYSVTLLGGADIFTAAGGAINAVQLTAGVTSLGAMTQGITVFGGDGNDTLQGGDGNDTLNGGNNDDTFKTSTGALADGNDVYIGGPGIDTIDYSGRTSDLTVTIGPAHATITGSVDLSSLTYPTGPNGKVLVLSIDGAANVTTTLASPADENAIASQINTAVGSTVATVNATHHLVLNSLSSGPSTTIQAVVGGSALAYLGVAAGTANGANGNDGQSGESDDVTYTVENIIGGSGNDALTGSDQYNVITGGAGNDTIDGVANATCPVSGAGDTLNGGLGNDIFLMGAVANCGVVVSGGAGIDTVDYSSRTAAVNVSLDGTANDGDPTANSGAGEKGNLNATDLEIVLGGSGNDTLTASALGSELHGGAGNDTLNGGNASDVLVGDSGNDTINGGAGDDYIVESAALGALASTMGMASTLTPALSGTPTAYANVVVVITTGGTTGGTAISYKVSQDNGATFPTTQTGVSGASITVSGVTLALGSPKVAVTGDTFTWKQFAPTSGSGNDLINGGTGVDKVDYSGRAGNLTITLCVDPAATGAPTANPLPAECSDSDGDPAVLAATLGVTGAVSGAGGKVQLTMASTATLATGDTVTVAAIVGTTEANGTWVINVDDATHITLTGTTFANAYTSGGTVAAHRPESDNLVNVEWLVGGAGNDTLTGSTADETIEGGAGNDTIHGGAGNDTLYGDAGNDFIYGDAGDDYCEGGAGDDFINGGAGDGDICVADAADVTTPAPLNCEL
jgi:Ca2+-binding RTX toxin-like protein